MDYNESKIYIEMDVTNLISWIVLLFQIIGIIASLASSIVSGSTWTMVLVWSVIGTMWVTSATFGLGNWIIVKFISSFIPIPTWAITYLLSGNFLSEIVAKRVLFIVGIIESVIVFPINLLLMWVVNTIILQISILIQCKKIDIDSLSIAATNALAGAIPTSIHLLAWGILAAIPVIIGPIMTLIETLPYTFTFGLIHVPTIIAILFNLGFGALGNKIAMDKACPTLPSPTLTPTQDNTTKEQFDGKYLSVPDLHNHTHAGYGPYDRCRCRCCPVCNK